MTVAEWLSTKFEEVEPMEFYREIFPCGSLEAAGVEEEGKYAGIVIERTGEKRLVQTPRGEKERELVRKYLVFDELDILDELQKTTYQRDSSILCSCAFKTFAKYEKLNFPVCVTVDSAACSISDTEYCFKNMFNFSFSPSERGLPFCPSIQQKSISFTIKISFLSSP